ncbi:MAG: hypothetical protein EAZ92_06780 [Candidatus Kapaibacterium sp.]|nr:MAG: hypothetical protein EAZ92_06780 [Candidatus Kapabacteria bacterium]
MITAHGVRINALFFLSNSLVSNSLVSNSLVSNSLVSNSLLTNFLSRSRFATNARFCFRTASTAPSITATSGCSAQGISSLRCGLSAWCAFCVSRRYGVCVV